MFTSETVYKRISINILVGVKAYIKQEYIQKSAGFIIETTCPMSNTESNYVTLFKFII